MARSSLSSMTVPDVPTDARSGASGSRSTASGLVLSLRPGQWTKNFLVFAPLLFAVKLFDLNAVARAAETRESGACDIASRGWVSSS